MSVKEDLTPRNHIIKTIRFKQVDIVPWYENFIPELIIKWISEGLPIDGITRFDHRVAMGQLVFNRLTFTGFDVQSLFGIHKLRSLLIPIDEGPIPRFKYRVISENDRYMEYIMENGATA